MVFSMLSWDMCAFLSCNSRGNNHYIRTYIIAFACKSSRMYINVYILWAPFPALFRCTDFGTCMSNVCLSVCLSVSMCVTLSVSASVSISVHLSICVYVCVCVCKPKYFAVHISGPVYPMCV